MERLTHALARLQHEIRTFIVDPATAPAHVRTESNQHRAQLPVFGGGQHREVFARDLQVPAPVILALRAALLLLVPMLIIAALSGPVATAVAQRIG